MKKLISLGCLEILFLVFISFKLCESGDKSNKISIDDFPMTVGSQWTYLRTDSLAYYMGYRTPSYTVRIETVTVQITRAHKKKRKEIITEWVRTFPSKVDTQYVVIKKDTLRLLTSMDPTERHVVFQFIFPLKAGKSWNGPYPFPSDSSKVVQPEPIEVAAGKFTEAFLISREIWSPNSLGHRKYWIVPKVGIVKMSKSNLFTLGPEYNAETWELIKYDIRK